MLKLLHNDDTQNTPFVATKYWALNNVLNEDSILMEHSGSDGPAVALEYLTLLPNVAVTASNPCNIALEQQTNDKARFRDGTKITGIFYPDTDPKNLDGTYQRVVYAQVVKMFYNDYRDPTKIWGLEKIDFDTSKTKRFLSDKFKMFEIPQPVYGEKIIPNTVIMFDKTTDNDYEIKDDGNCNLFAGTNLFAHQQELGNYFNQFISGSSGACDYYYGITGSNPPPTSSCMVLDHYVNVENFVFQISNTGQELSGLAIISSGGSSAIFDTTTETITVHLSDLGVAALGGVHAPPHHKFFLVNPSGNVDVIDEVGNVLASSILPKNLAIDAELLYNFTTDKLYAVTEDFINPFMINEIDPVSYAVVEHTSSAANNFNIATGGTHLAVYASNVSQIDIFDTSNLDSVNVTVDVSAYPGGVSYGACYDSTRGKMYFAVLKHNTDFNASAVIEVNPSTGTIDHEYDFGPMPNGGIYGLSYNSVTDKVVVVYNDAFNGGFAISPATQTTCSIDIPLFSNSALDGPVASDSITGKTFLPLGNFGGSDNGMGVLI